MNHDFQWFHPRDNHFWFCEVLNYFSHALAGQICDVNGPSTWGREEVCRTLMNLVHWKHISKVNCSFILQVESPINFKSSIYDPLLKEIHQGYQPNESFSCREASQEAGILRTSSRLGFWSLGAMKGTYKENVSKVGGLQIYTSHAFEVHWTIYTKRRGNLPVRAECRLVKCCRWFRLVL